MERLERRRALEPADGHGQHPRHRRLPGHRSHAARAGGHRAHRGGLPADLPRQQGLHQPAAQVQRHHHRLPRELHGTRDPGHLDDAGRPHDRGRRRGGLQPRRRRQAGLGRPDVRHAARRLRPAGGGGRGLRRHRPHLPGPRPARGAQQGPAGLPDRGVGRATLPRRAGGTAEAPAAAGRPRGALDADHGPRRHLPPEAAGTELRGPQDAGGSGDRRSAVRAGAAVGGRTGGASCASRRCRTSSFPTCRTR